MNNLQAGKLYIVATPIGNLADISRRAIEILSSVTVIAAEDTRHSKKLLMSLGIDTPLISLHEHNESKIADEIIERIKQGQNIALISDAGTPLIQDPGYRLVQKAQEQHITVSPIPGACAFVAALSVAGLATDRFVFEGFLPVKKEARMKRLQALCNEERTIIFYEAPHRILSFIDELEKVFGKFRQIVIARELTKTFETIHKATLSEIKKWMSHDPNQQRGEFVVLIEGNSHSNEERATNTIDKKQLLEILLQELPVKQAASLAAKILQQSKNELYQLALELKAGFPLSRE